MSDASGKQIRSKVTILQMHLAVRVEVMSGIKCKASLVCAQKQKALVATFTNQHEHIHCIPEHYSHFLSRSDSQQSRQRVNQNNILSALLAESYPTEEFPEC